MAAFSSLQAATIYSNTFTVDADTAVAGRPPEVNLTGATYVTHSTDPNDRASVFKISRLSPGEGRWLVSFPTKVAKNYRLESSPFMVAGSWTTIQGKTWGTGGVIQIPPVASPPAGVQFYRARVLP